MKKFTLILILICYSIASFGVSVNYSYCCDELEEVTILSPTKIIKAEDEDGSCCKTEHKTIKLKLDQKKQDSKSVLFFASIDAVEVQAFPCFQNNLVLPTTSFKLEYQLPPPKKPFKRNILYCTYLI